MNLKRFLLSAAFAGFTAYSAMQGYATNPRGNVAQAYTSHGGSVVGGVGTSRNGAAYAATNVFNTPSRNLTVTTGARHGDVAAYSRYTPTTAKHYAEVYAPRASFKTAHSFSPGLNLSSYHIASSRMGFLENIAASYCQRESSGFNSQLAKLDFSFPLPHSAKRLQLTLDKDFATSKPMSVHYRIC